VAGFEHRLRVRYSECDQQGVVFNAHYVAYIDLLMTELWREVAGGYREMVAAGTDMVVAEVRVRYLGPARFDDELTLEASILRLGNTAMTSKVEIARDGAPVAEGEVSHVFVDPATQAKKPIPDDVRRALEPLLAESEPVA
jgi:acyl-CoA thioester hydrolase